MPKEGRTTITFGEPKEVFIRLHGLRGYGRIGLKYRDVVSIRVDIGFFSIAPLLHTGKCPSPCDKKVNFYFPHYYLRLEFADGRKKEIALVEDWKVRGESFEDIKALLLQKLYKSMEEKCNETK